MTWGDQTKWRVLPGGLALYFGPNRSSPPTSHHKTVHKQRLWTLSTPISTYTKSPLLSRVFFSHLVVPVVLAAQQVPVIPAGPALVRPEGPASLAVLGGQGRLWGDRDRDQVSSDVIWNLCAEDARQGVWKYLANRASFEPIMPPCLCLEERLSAAGIC